MEIYKRLLIYLKPYRTRLLLAAVFMLLTSGMIAGTILILAGCWLVLSKRGPRDTEKRGQPSATRAH